MQLGALAGTGGASAQDPRRLAPSSAQAPVVQQGDGAGGAFANGAAAGGEAERPGDGERDTDVAAQRAQAKLMNDKFAQECQTCKNRRYQDGSNDGGVSFKTPGHISPEASASVVAAHEQEHVSRNRAAAEAEGGEVVSSRVVLHGAFCPECGRYYIAGGTTYTTTSHAHGQKKAPDEGTLDVTA